MKPGPERDYFAGVLAAREGRDEDASRLFTQALPWLRRTEPDQAALALRLLANVYDREGLYGRSEPLYSELELSGGMNRLPESYRSGAHDDAELARVLANSRAQTLTWDGTVHLVTTRNNPLGLITTELTVNGVKSEWVLDTGANQLVVSRSFASQLQLAMLPGVAHTSGGITGTENALRVAVLPRLPLGGATVHDVPLLVLATPVSQFLMARGNLSHVSEECIDIGMLPARHPHLDHGYAVTSHSSQGQTAERVLVRPREAARRAGP